MTNPNLTLIAALLDRSGSMASIADDMRGGFDSLIAEERAAAGSTRVTLAQFDDEYEVVYRDQPIGDVPSLVLRPRGCTALLDAIGRFVTDIGSGLAALPEADRPGRVVLLVMTDGMENASKEWKHADVQRLVARQEAVYGWEPMFLGANMDAIDVGTDLGFTPDKSLTYAASSTGVAGAFESVVRYRKRTRAMSAEERLGAGFDDADRRRAGPR